MIEPYAISGTSSLQSESADTSPVTPRSAGNTVGSTYLTPVTAGALRARVLPVAGVVGCTQLAVWCGYWGTAYTVEAHGQTKMTRAAGYRWGLGPPRGNDVLYCTRDPCRVETHILGA
jgi:hypothetical protein